MNDDNDQHGETVLTPTSSRTRRRWTDDEKMAIVQECAEPGSTVYAVSKKHGIPTNQIYQWRKLFEISDSSRSAATALSLVDECRKTLTKIERLDRIGQMIMEKLADEIRKNKITSYNASIAVSSLVTGLTKLSGLTFEVLDRVAQLEGTQNDAAESEYTVEEERTAERLCFELVQMSISKRKAEQESGQPRRLS